MDTISLFWFIGFILFVYVIRKEWIKEISGFNTGQVYLFVLLMFFIWPYVSLRMLYNKLKK